MALLELFIASSMPVIKVLLITALGSFLALDRINVLGEDARKHLNKIVFYVFNPALVASNLAKALSHETITMMWYMALNILVTFVTGSVLGFIIVRVTKPPRHLRGLILGCCAAGNMGNMLFIIIPTVCREKGTPFGAPDECHTYGMAYASLSMAIGAIYLWSYVYNLVRMCSSKEPKEVEINDSSVGNASIGAPLAETRNSNVPLLPPKGCKIPINQPVLKPPCSESETPLVDTRNSTVPLLPTKECKIPVDQPVILSPCTEPETSEVGVTVKLKQVGVTDKLKQQMRKVLTKTNLKTVFAPSTTGAIAGFIIGLVPTARRLMIGESAPLHVIQDSALLLGDGSIPSVTLIMGGNLLKGLRRSEIQKSLVVWIIVARYLALPMIGTAIIKGAIHFALVPKDPLYQFVLLLQFAVPPAMNIATITQLFGAGENECSVIMLWTYVLASVALTLWSTFFMWLVA